MTDLPEPAVNPALAASSGVPARTASSPVPPVPLGQQDALLSTPDAPNPADTAASATMPTERSGGMLRKDQWFAGSCLMVALGLLLISGLRVSRWGQQSIELSKVAAAPDAYHVEINTATWVEFALLEGVGETLAKRIIADRTEHGPYQSIEDLLRVPGIGARKFAGMQRWLRCLPVVTAASERP